MKSNGFSEETRIYAHGMGYDMVERPSIMPGEKLTIQARMNLAVHPAMASANAMGQVCDNFLVAENGTPVRLHKTAQKVFVI